MTVHPSNLKTFTYFSINVSDSLKTNRKSKLFEKTVTYDLKLHHEVLNVKQHRQFQISLLPYLRLKWNRLIRLAFHPKNAMISTC